MTLLKRTSARRAFTVSICILVALTVFYFVISSEKSRTVRNKALAQAVARGNLSAVTALLERGADPNARLTGDVSPVGFLEQLKAMFHKDRAPGGLPVLVLACAQRRRDIAAVLVRAGADPNQLGIRGLTALQVSAAANDTFLCSQLLVAGADPNKADLAGVTPLMSAATMGHSGIIQLLLSHGARINMVDVEHRTALDRAEAAGKTDTVTILKLWALRHHN